MASEPFIYIWTYEVRPERRAEFLSAYRPDGDWAELFRKDPDYYRTELFCDSQNPNRFMTLDFWRSRAARDAFRQRYAREFAALDEACEAFTISETNIGDFEHWDRAVRDV